jgi:hypothetical protein
VWSALLGALVIGSISNGMDLLALESSVKFMVTGAVLLAAVIIDAIARQQRRPRAGSRAPAALERGGQPRSSRIVAHSPVSRRSRSRSPRRPNASATSSASSRSTPPATR